MKIKQEYLYFGIGIVVVYLIYKAQQNSGGQVTLQSFGGAASNVQVAAPPDNSLAFAQLGAEYAITRAQQDNDLQLGKQALSLQRYQLDTAYDVEALRTNAALQASQYATQAQAAQTTALLNAQLAALDVQSKTALFQSSQQRQALETLAKSQARHWYDSLLSGVGTGLSAFIGGL